MQYQIVVGEGQIDNEAWQPATPGQTIDGLHHNETVYGRLFDGTNESKVYATTTVKDEEGPEVSVSTSNVTTNGATLEVTASDGESGLAETDTYQYYVDEETEARETSTNSSYNYTGLTQGIEHTLKVIVTDRAGNTTEKTTTITTTNLPGGQEAVEQGIITFTDPTWTSGKASVTISTNTSNTLQYQVVAGEGAIVEENWQTVSEGGVIGNLNHNDTVYARLTDGNNYGEDASTTVKDENPPQTATIQLSNTSVTTGTNVTATVTHIDNESGPNIAQCKYIWNTSSTRLGTDASKYTGGTFSSNGQQISRNMSSKGTYYLHVLTVDKAGNSIETVSSGITVRQLVTGITVSPSSVTLEEGQTRQLTASVSPSTANNKTVTWSSSNATVASVSTSGVVTAKTAGNATITATAKDGSGKKGTCKVTVETAGIPTNTSYVGYYADVDGNGSVDGVIYADLAIGGSGRWYNINGTYSIPKESNLKNYKEEGTYTASGFGTKGVIKPLGGSGKDRFYVMALKDVDSERYQFWDSDGTSVVTSIDFGTGESNTAAMRKKSGSSNYLWGQIGSQVANGWYVPSRGEWAAFGAAFDIDGSNNSDYGLQDFYWTSSQNLDDDAWFAYLRDGCIQLNYPTLYTCIRMGTNF